MKRFNYIDWLRGLAIVFMVINHVGHYLVSQPLSSYLIYFSVYLTVTWAAPLFLFLTGYSLALGEQKMSALNKPLSFKYFLKRGSVIILAGILVNVLFYWIEAPWYFGRVLLTIGCGLLLAYPLVKYLKTKRDLILAGLLSFGLILLYPLTFNSINAFVAQQTWLGQMAFGEFSFHPWLLLIFLGLIFGKYFSNLTVESQATVVKKIGFGGISLLGIWLVLSLIYSRAFLFLFNYDFSLNNIWVPSNLTWLWIFGSLSVFFWLMFSFQMKNYFWLRGLGILGRNALVVYFLQFFIIKTIGSEVLGISLSYFYQTVVADLIVILILCYLVKSKIFAKIMALNPLVAKGKIS